MNYADVIYLSAHLRNAIRGHGTVSLKDTKNVMILTFKLMLAIYYVLEIDEMYFKYGSDGNNGYGIYGNTTLILKDYKLDQAIQKEQMHFLILSNGQMKVFNNYVKNNQKHGENGMIEYIDYGTGTLKTYLLM